MKRIHVFIILCIFLLSQIHSEEEKFTISKIKVFLDDIELIGADDGSVKKSTILSYTNFSEEKSYSENQIEKECEKTRLRLIDSGLFYSTEVEAVKSRINPTAVLIIISVRKGFLMRFGGGAVYGMFGRVALGGNRNKLLGYAGYNKSGLSYLDENVAGIPLVLGAGLFTNVPQALCEKENYKLESNLKTGFYIAPDFCIGNDIKFIFDFGKSKETEFNLDYLLSPYIFLKLFHSEKVFSTTEVRSYNYILQNAHSIEAAYTINCSPAKKFNLAVLLSCGFSKDTKINLQKDSQPFYEQPGLGNRAVRAGYKEEELLTDTYCLCTFEGRFKAASFSIPPCFPCQLVPYVFTDLAFTENYGKAPQLLDAFGLGIQLNMENPVFAYFNFSYGINHFGKGKFTFVAMQSF